MPSLTAAAAAAAIYKDVDPHHDQKIDVSHRRMQAFLHEVAVHLGLEPNDANKTHVAEVLAKHGISPLDTSEFPKMALDEDGKPVVRLNKNTGKPNPGDYVIFASAEEERAYQA